MLEGIGTGNLCRLRSPNRYGRELPVATVLASGKVALAKWLKKAMREREENVQRPTSNAQRRSNDEGLRENAERPTPNVQRRSKDRGKNAELRKLSQAGAQGPTRTWALNHEEFESEVRPLLPELVAPGTIVDWIMFAICSRK